MGKIPSVNKGNNYVPNLNIEIKTEEASGNY